MIGNEEDAALALEGEAEYVGEGCTRTVYRVGDVVYKVEVHPGANNSEYLNGLDLRENVPASVIIPPMSLYFDGKVLAMPYIEGETRDECMARYVNTPDACDHTACYDDETHTMLSRINYDAVSYGNVVYRGGFYYMIDLGHRDVRTYA